MTQPEGASTLRDERVYVVEGRPFPSVSTAKSALRVPALDRWKLKRYATIALTDPKVRELFDSGHEDTAIGYVADEFYKPTEASGRGDDVHHLIEDVIVNGIDRPVPDELKGYVLAARLCLADHGITIALAERTVVNVDRYYAGTADAFVYAPELGDGLLIFDWKTGAVFDDVALQLAGYANVTHLAVVTDGKITGLDDLPDGVNRDVGLIGQLREDGTYTLHLYRLRPEAWEAFQAACIAWWWNKEDSGKVGRMLPVPARANAYARETMAQRIRSLPADAQAKIKAGWPVGAPPLSSPYLATTTLERISELVTAAAGVDATTGEVLEAPAPVIGAPAQVDDHVLTAASQAAMDAADAGVTPLGVVEAAMTAANAARAAGPPAELEPDTHVGVPDTVVELDADALVGNAYRGGALDAAACPRCSDSNVLTFHTGPEKCPAELEAPDDEAPGDDRAAARELAEAIDAHNAGIKAPEDEVLIVNAAGVPITRTMLMRGHATPDVLADPAQIAELRDRFDKLPPDLAEQVGAAAVAAGIPHFGRTERWLRIFVLPTAALIDEGAQRAAARHGRLMETLANAALAGEQRHAVARWASEGRTESTRALTATEVDWAVSFASAYLMGAAHIEDGEARMLAQVKPGNAVDWKAKARAAGLTKAAVLRRAKTIAASCGEPTGLTDYGDMGPQTVDAVDAWLTKVATA